MDKKCIICSFHKQKGMKILDSFICTRCINLISTTEVENPNYSDILNRMKKIWNCDGQAAES
ncbi:sigma factor G inhibitor Gin [Proteinivorax hydrogeniformans]|uniref:Sigma factor G inhibitor Gin n=1 Tax=Proteinivorax hydrogeniformans TaxID=1826727 RepID=A0AAU8HTY5_9FIRM